MASKMPGHTLVRWIAHRLERGLFRFGLGGQDTGEETRDPSGRIRIREEEFFRDEDRYLEASQQGCQVIVTDGNGGTRLVLGSSPDNPFPEPDPPQLENGEGSVPHARPEGEKSSWLQ